MNPVSNKEYLLKVQKYTSLCSVSNKKYVSIGVAGFSVSFFAVRTLQRGWHDKKREKNC